VTDLEHIAVVVSPLLVHVESTPALWVAVLLSEEVVVIWRLVSLDCWEEVSR
jgi:hypothetical protein